MDAKMLDGKVAIVSGASYGMGQTMAELFAKEGAKVVMTARGKDKLNAAVEELRSKGLDVTGVVADNKNLDDVKKVIQTAIDTLTKNVAMRLIDTNIRINAVAPGATVTPAHLANKAGEQPGGAKMLEYSKHFVYFPGPECDPIDQANACLFLASDMGRHVKGQVIQVCNGAFL